MSLNKTKIAIIGLGYVGLPLAVEFAKKFDVIGYDLNKERINQLKNYFDQNNDISKVNILNAKKLSFTVRPKDIKYANVFIITVPTPVFKNKKPNLNNIKVSCKLIAKFLKKNDIVILESTVYPGVTEEIVAPILEKHSKLIYNIDFFLGYSPERINPNDKKHSLSNIVKVTSGSNFKTSLFVDKLYKSIIKAGTKNVSNIRVAEAAKVIENSQRDLNIAFMNELVLIFDKLNINTEEVLSAASTKWNFLNFKPGLVGGHCIGVDPYYLTYKSNLHGYSPQVIGSGRKINDYFPYHIAKKTIKEISINSKHKRFRILIMGLAFKENCNDYRNSKSIKLNQIFRKKNIIVECFDPMLSPDSFINHKEINLVSKLKKNFFDCIIIAVKHNIFKNIGEKKIRESLKKNGKLFDLKNMFKFNKSNINI